MALPRTLSRIKRGVPLCLIATSPFQACLFGSGDSGPAAVIGETWSAPGMPGFIEISGDSLLFYRKWGACHYLAGATAILTVDADSQRLEGAVIPDFGLFEGGLRKEKDALFLGDDGEPGRFARVPKPACAERRPIVALDGFSLGYNPVRDSLRVDFTYRIAEPYPAGVRAVGWSIGYYTHEYGGEGVCPQWSETLSPPHGAVHRSFPVVNPDDPPDITHCGPFLVQIGTYYTETGPDGKERENPLTSWIGRVGDPFSY